MMKYDFTGFKIIAKNEIEIKAAELLCEEFAERGWDVPAITDKECDGNALVFTVSNPSDDEAFEILHTENRIVITAHRLRSLIYGYSKFLRKAEMSGGQLCIIKNISGSFTPSMKIRGHQLAYTDMNNTCEAWDKAQFRRYIRDMMYFGSNMIEATTTKDEERTSLMKYTYKEALDIESEICKELDLGFSVWHPLSTKLDDAQTLEQMHGFYDGTPKLDVIFPPGGDPGDLKAEDFVERCRKMKNEISKTFPDAQMWPSAQAPHQYRDWGEKFTQAMDKLPDEIDGVIYGPNHAMPLDELRKKINIKYPLRFYPDIAHNVRCEIPVHFNRNDWHYSLTSTMSRESVNPRPTEYRLMHRITRQYVTGSVTYSEGVNDDVNKCVWADMDFDCNVSTRETLCDYARLFFNGTDSEAVADIIFGFEHNWNGDPIENPNIANVHRAMTDILSEHAELENNWRFMLLYFRAKCDLIVRNRRLFETELIADAKTQAFLGNEAEAVRILETPYPASYNKLRGELFPLAQKLHELIGIQLDVEHFGGMREERGCTLDTIDNPVTDRQWLLNKHSEGIDLKALFNRNTVDADEYYFSFAEHGFDVCGTQQGEFYMDFQGDDNGDSKLPMCMLNVYDHFNFRTKIAGLTGGDYKLIITYKSRSNSSVKHHRIVLNSNVIHDGGFFGGVRDTEFEKKYLADGFEAVVYDIPKEFLINGCGELEITEPVRGFMISEFRFVKAQ